MDDIATLALKIKSDDALRSLDQVSKKTTNLGDVAKQTATVLGSLFIGSKIAGFGKDFLMAASDLQEAGGKMEAVFKSQTASAERYVSSLVDSFNFSRKQASDSLSTMADIFQKTGLDIKTSMQYAFDLNKQAADIDAFSNVVGGVDRVTQALTSAMLGETEAAKSLGVVILDANVKAQMAKNSQEGLTFATEAAAQAHARFQLIMENSANATGQVVREGDNFGNQLRKLKAGVDDLKTSFGTALIEPATAVVRTLKAGSDALNRISPNAKTAVVAAAALGTAFVAVGIPIAKLVAGFKTYWAIQAQTAIANKTTAASVKKMTFDEFRLAEAEKIAAIAVTSSTAAIAEETAVLNVNTAAKKRNNAENRGVSLGGKSPKSDSIKRATPTVASVAPVASVPDFTPTSKRGTSGYADYLLRDAQKKHASGTATLDGKIAGIDATIEKQKRLQTTFAEKAVSRQQVIAAYQTRQANLDGLISGLKSQQTTTETASLAKQQAMNDLISQRAEIDKKVAVVKAHQVTAEQINLQRQLRINAITLQRAKLLSSRAMLDARLETFSETRGSGGGAVKSGFAAFDARATALQKAAERAAIERMELQKTKDIPNLKNRVFDRVGGMSKRERKLARKSVAGRAAELAIKRNSQLEQGLGLSARKTKSAFARRAAEKALLPTVSKKASAAARVTRLASLKDIAMKSLTFSKHFSKLGSVIGRIAGPVGAAIGALEAFRHAPKWIESFVHEAWPKIKGFFSELPGKIGGWMSSAWSGTTEWLGEAFLGMGQTVKRLAGFETEASKEYALNEKIEAAAKARQKLLDFRMKNEEYERKLDESTLSRKLANKTDYVGYLAERSPDTMKLAAAQASLGTTNTEMVNRRQELENIKHQMGVNQAFGEANPGMMDPMQQQNEALAERAEKLNTEMEGLGKTWVDQQKAVDDLSKAVVEAADQIRDSQEKFQSHLRDNQEAELGYNRDRKLGQAKSGVAKRGLLSEEKAFQQSKIVEADQAQSRAIKASKALEGKSADLYDPAKNKAIAEMKQLTEAGSVTPESQKRFRELYEGVTGRYNSTRDSDFTLETMQNYYGGIQGDREKLGKEVEGLLKTRDENQAIADTRLSHIQGRDQATDRLKELDKTEADKAFSMKTQDQQIKSVLGDVRGIDTLINEYRTKEKRAGELESEIADLQKKKTKEGLTPEEEKALKDKSFEKTTLGGWLSKNAEDYAAAKDERVGKTDQLDELLRPIAEKNFEEVNTAKKNAGKAIGPQSAMEAGSSAAFQIQNKIYNQYQKNMEQNTKNIADYLKSIRDQILAPEDGSIAVEVA